MTIQFKGRNVVYHIFGTGEKKIMLVHGYPENSIVFKNQYEYLSKHYTVIVIDLPGAGESEYNDELLTVDDFADAVNAVLETESITKCTMLGHSMGGYITLAFAEKYPEKLNGFGLIHSHALPDDQEKIKNREKTIESVKEYGSEPFVKKMIPGLFTEENRTKLKNEIDVLIDNFKLISEKAVIRFSEIMIKRPDRRHVLKNAKVPILFILGEQDESAKLDVVMPQTYLADEGFVKILSDVAHMGMLEDAEDVNETIDEFVSNV